MIAKVAHVLLWGGGRTWKRMLWVARSLLELLSHSLRQDCQAKNPTDENSASECGGAAATGLFETGSRLLSESDRNRGAHGEQSASR